MNKTIHTSQDPNLTLCDFSFILIFATILTPCASFVFLNIEISPYWFAKYGKL